MFSTPNRVTKVFLPEPSLVRTELGRIRHENILGRIRIRMYRLSVSSFPGGIFYRIIPDAVCRQNFRRGVLRTCRPVARVPDALRRDGCGRTPAGVSLGGT